MGWLSDLFSSSQRTRKGQTIFNTNDAFSLPTSSSHPDAFNPDALPTPRSPASPSVFTYPPQGPGSYGYVPTSAGLSRPGSIAGGGAILPTHMDAHHSPLFPHLPYPPLAKTWARIRAWLSREYPELGDTLNYGILPQDLAEIEMQFGFSLPQVVRDSYLCCDGQEAESAAGCSEGLFFGLTLLPLEDVLEEWRFWREVDSDPATGASEKLKEIMQSVPPGWVRREYSQRGWIPLIADRAGNYVGVDLNPAEAGQVGQVIVFGRDFDTKVVLWKGDGQAGWAKWLGSFVEELETGEGFELGPAEASDDSEDDLGYEGYFYDGKGRGQGDGGGDTGGTSGLRLTGEYKGWNVMEAWADRSVRKWHEAGLIADVPLIPPEEVKVKGTETIEVADINHGSGAEIPIPVLADVDEPIPPPTTLALNGKRASKNIPTISVTKPPAPRPLVLPTVQDIEVELSPTSFDDEGGDLEAGRGRGMRERDYDQKTPTQARRPMQQPKPISPVSHDPELELADLRSPPADSTTPLVQALAHPLADVPPVADRPATVPDLMADSVRHSLETKPIKPPALPVVVVVDQPSRESPKLVDTEVAEEKKVAREEEDESEDEDDDEEDGDEEDEGDDEDDDEEGDEEGEGKTEEDEQEDQEEEGEEEPPTTIRLIGGGGTVGAVPLEPQSSSDSETVQVESAAEVQKQKEADTVSIKSAGSSSSSKQQGHKKKSSALAGLKRLSQFGGLKKKDSVGSVKDTAKDR